MPKDGTTPQGRQIYRCPECHRRYQPDAADHRPGPAVKEPASGDVLRRRQLLRHRADPGRERQSVSNRVKRGHAVLAGMRERSRQRTEVRAVLIPAAVISCDDQWTYLKTSRRSRTCRPPGLNGRLAEADGSVRVDFEVGDRGARTFSQWYERLP